MVSRIHKIRIFTALFSLILSVIAYYFDDLINNDGILYMQAAQAYLKGGFSASAEIYPWPFFSVIVAFIHQLSGFTLEVSAYILNTFLFVLLTDVLVQLSKKLLVDDRQLFVAVLLILCFFTLNEYRHYIIRDIGYWAFCCWALFRFIEFIEKSSLKNFIYWQFTILISILFRLDGLVIFLGLPVYLLVISSSKYMPERGFRPNYKFIFSLTLISTLLIGTALVTTLVDTVDIYNSYTNTGEGKRFLALFENKVSIIETQILNKYSADYSVLVLVSGLIMMMVYKLIKGMSISYLGVYLVSWMQQQKIAPNKYRSLLLYFIGLNILLLLTVLFHRYFVSQRHAIIVSIGILLLMLPRLTTFIQQIWESRNKKWQLVIAALLLINLIDGVTQTNSKSYIKDTAVWASENLTGSMMALTDDRAIEYYYNNQTSSVKLIRDKNIDLYQRYAYLILIEKYNDEERRSSLKTMNLDPIFNLGNSRGDKATVYKVLPER
ncbi:MAG: hypothetical protein AB8D52_01570 [Gammaproteobacteria bacterium]